VRLDAYIVEAVFSLALTVIATANYRLGMPQRDTFYYYLYGRCIVKEKFCSLHT